MLSLSLRAKNTSNFKSINKKPAIPFWGYAGFLMDKRLVRFDWNG